jgi:1-hydroxycarotenoid 3,4-desaturase
MQNLALGLRRALEQRGVQIILDTRVDRVDVTSGRATGLVLEGGGRIEAEAVVLNADPHAVARGALGEAVRSTVKLPAKDPRSLSAMTWSMLACPAGFDLAYHTVFFSDDYRDEFRRIFEQDQLPNTPTVYICAQDRGVRTGDPQGPERIFMLVNAPPVGDRHDFAAEVQPCTDRTLQHLRRCGLELETSPEHSVVTTPNDFARMFPGTGGALYGPATHGAMAPFSRPNPQTKLPNMYLVGGGIHPGAGVPMVALGGKAVASCLLADHPSIYRSRPGGTHGGMSTVSATTGAMR